jgi:hypothetical protein
MPGIHRYSSANMMVSEPAQISPLYAITSKGICDRLSFQGIEGDSDESSQWLALLHSVKGAERRERAREQKRCVSRTQVLKTYRGSLSQISRLSSSFFAAFSGCSARILALRLFNRANLVLRINAVDAETNNIAADMPCPFL